MKTNSKKGFTVIELLAVVVVIAIISLIAIASVFTIMQRARERQYKTNLDSMKSSVKLFADDSKNGLSKINNALVYKDDDGKTWKIGCEKKDSNKRECCIKMALLKDLGYLRVTEEDMCGDSQKCIDYSSKISYSGNSIDIYYDLINNKINLNLSSAVINKKRYKLNEEEFNNILERIYINKNHLNRREIFDGLEELKEQIENKDAKQKRL